MITGYKYLWTFLNLHLYNMYTYTSWRQYSFIFLDCLFDGCCDSGGWSHFFFSLDRSVVHLRCVLCFLVNLVKYNQDRTGQSNFLTSEVLSDLDQVIIGYIGMQKQAHARLTSIFDIQYVWEFETEHFYRFLTHLHSRPEASFLLGTTSQEQT